jgi:hypothetical protein
MNDSFDLSKIEELLIQIKKGINLDSAYYNLGIIYARAEDYDKAKNYFLLSIKYNPNFIDSYLNLGIIYGKLKDYKTSIEYLKKALQFKPNNSLVYYNLAYAFQEFGKVDEAIDYYSLAIKYNPQDAKSYFNRSLLYLLKGNYVNGWKDYFAWGYKSGDLKKRELKGKLWNGEPLDGKVLLIYCDQGYGDSINFIRFLKFIKNSGAFIIVEVQQSLYRLFANIPYIDKLIVNPNADKENCDYHAPIFLLAKFYHPDYNKQIEFPYLSSLESESKKWKLYVGNNKKVKIGFVWKGNPYPQINNKRHLSLENYYKLFAIENTEWYSLYPEKNDEITIAKKIFDNVYDLTGNLIDFSSTAALMSNLDLILTIDSAVVHLAGALNLKTLLLLNYMPDWRWGLHSTQTEIYPTVKIFRQKELGKWDYVINEIYDYIINQKFNK